MPTINIDGKSYEYTGEGRNLLDVCLTLGRDVPYFCWHPAMGSLGACRQCAVKLYANDTDTRGRIVMSCMTPVSPGMRISVSDPEVAQFRSHITEWLMVNHPHDCPVCDEGGECHLQDMTVMTGHVRRRSRFPKRTFRNQNLGPFIAHEMNRCIQCYRCVRFYKNYAGGTDFGVSGWHDRLYFGRFEDGTLESPFSGNLVEICPTGVFTDKTFAAHTVRSWDLATAPSVCEHCSLGCNTLPGERYGTLRRIRNRYNGSVNGYFLCDRGRYGYGYVSDEKRIHVCGVREDGREIRATSGTDMLERLGRALRGKRILGIGSPRASLESNYALRELVGPERFYQGLASADWALAREALACLEGSGVPIASLADTRTSDAVFLLGEDVEETAPLLALELRQASRQKAIREAAKLAIAPWDDGALRDFAQDERGPFIAATPWATALEGLATLSLRGSPVELARFAHAVSRELDPKLPAVAGLAPEVAAKAAEAAAQLRASVRPVVVAGTGLGSPELLGAAATVARALAGSGREARICLALPECNTMGAALLGAAGALEEAAARVRAGDADALVVLENDLYRRWDATRVTELLSGVPVVVVLDHLESETTKRAHYVLPASVVAESEGTFVNNEGRAQRFFKVMAPHDSSRESWRWLSQLGAALRDQTDGRALDAVLEALAVSVPRLAAVREAAPPASYRIHGQKIPRQPARYTGRTSMHANLTVREPRPLEDPDSALAFTMEGYPGEVPAPLATGFWSPGWNSVQALTKFQQEAGGHLHGGDPGVLVIRPETGREAVASAPPAAARGATGEVLLLPAHHIYGSGELSSRSPSIAGRAPSPYLGLGEEGAASLGLTASGRARLEAGGVSLDLEVRVLPGLPRDLAVVPVDLGRSPWLELPGWGRIRALGGAEMSATTRAREVAEC